jgi:hypothetical protein
MLHGLLLHAAEGAEPSRTAFYVAGGLLATWAVLVSLVGLRSPAFPRTRSAARGVMAVSAALVAAAVVASLLTA